MFVRQRQQEHVKMLDADLVRFDVGRELTRIKGEPEWLMGDRNAITLVTGPGIRVTLIALRKGARLQRDRLEGPFTMRILEGSVLLDAQGGQFTLEANSFVTLERHVAHDVLALEDCAFVLTLVPPQAFSGGLA